MSSRDRRRGTVHQGYVRSQGFDRSQGYARRWWRIAVGLMLIGCAILPVVAQEQPRDSAPAGPAPLAPLPAAARIVSVPLPLAGATGDAVVDQVLSAVARLPKGGATRPLLILEFLSDEATAGEGTEFEVALKLARTLTGEKLAGVRTVAFLPRSVKGHAVLPVIACDEIVMSSQAEFGAAGREEREIGPLLRASYEEIAERRRTVPKAVALAMLDRNVRLLKVQTIDGTRVIVDSELPELEKTTTISAVNTLNPEGDLASFTGATWRHELGFVSHLASDRKELAEALKISPAALDNNPLAGGLVTAVRIDFDGPVNARLVDRAIKILDDQLKRDELNLVFLWIRSEGGSLDEALRMAEYLAQIPRDRVRTVAYVSNQARGAAAIMALSTDELVMEENATLGGLGVGTIGERDLEAAIPRMRQIMSRHDRAWSPALALAGRSEPLRRYTHGRTGESRLMGDMEHSERDDRDDWSPQVDGLQLNREITTDEAIQYELAQHRAAQFNQVKRIYGVEGEIQTAQINWALALIERLADRQLSAILLFIGTFALFTELSSPGLGIPGFIAAVCFLLFFWANFLHGNAGLLELLLFVAGLLCILIEIFVAPGTMVFGVGGALMVVISIVLASQTFVFPTNAYQMQQLPGSLFSVTAAIVGGLAGMIVLQRYLPHTPYFKRLILHPPALEEAGETTDATRITSYEFLLGKRGVALTPLVPAGKARFGDVLVDVISEGPLVPTGTEITVTEAVGHRIKVRVIEA
jgi:membrane-bound serine protease (ClpP class)